MLLLPKPLRADVLMRDAFNSCIRPGLGCPLRKKLVFQDFEASGADRERQGARVEIVADLQIKHWLRSRWTNSIQNPDGIKSQALYALRIMVTPTKHYDADMVGEGQNTIYVQSHIKDGPKQEFFPAVDLSPLKVSGLFKENKIISQVFEKLGSGLGYTFDSAAWQQAQDYLNHLGVLDQVLEHELLSHSSPAATPIYSDDPRIRELLAPSTLGGHL